MVSAPCLDRAMASSTCRMSSSISPSSSPSLEVNGARGHLPIPPPREGSAGDSDEAVGDAVAPTGCVFGDCVDGEVLAVADAVVAHQLIGTMTKVRMKKRMREMTAGMTSVCDVWLALL